MKDSRMWTLILFSFGKWKRSSNVIFLKNFVMHGFSSLQERWWRLSFRNKMSQNSMSFVHVLHPSKPLCCCCQFHENKCSYLRLEIPGCREKKFRSQLEKYYRKKWKRKETKTSTKLHNGGRRRRKKENKLNCNSIVLKCIRQFVHTAFPHFFPCGSPNNNKWYT